MVLGSSVEQAVHCPAELSRLASLYRSERYILTYRKDSGKAHVVLRAGAAPADFLRAAFAAHVLLHLVDSGDAGLPWQQQPQQPVQQPGAAEGSRRFWRKGKAPAAAPGKAAAAEAAGAGSGAGVATAVAGSVGKLLGSIEQAVAGVAAAAGAAAAAEESDRATLALLDRVQRVVDASYPLFLKQAESQGWKLQQTMLNPKETRVVSMQLSPL